MYNPHNSSTLKMYHIGIHIYSKIQGSESVALDNYYRILIKITEWANIHFMHQEFQIYNFILYIFAYYKKIVSYMNQVKKIPTFY